MKRTPYVIASAVLSVLLHLLVLHAADRFKLKLFTPTDDDQEEKRIKVRAVDVRNQVLERRDRKEEARLTIKQMRDVMRSLDAEFVT